MRKSLLLFLLISCFLFSCNCGQQTAETGTTVVTNSDTGYKYPPLDKDCTLDGLITSEDGKEMMGNFEQRYKNDQQGRPIPAIHDSFWIDHCVLKDIVKHLKDKQNDGIRIYITCSSGITHPNDFFKYETSIDLLPTHKRIFSPAGVSRHQDDRAGFKISCVTGSEFVRPIGEVGLRSKKFFDIYRKAVEIPGRPKDCLSTSVWMRSCTFTYLDQLLDSNKSKVNGIMILMAAYSEAITGPAGSKENQSSVLIIPGNDRVPDWEILDNMPQPIRKVFNHGELCPQVCNN